MLLYYKQNKKPPSAEINSIGDTSSLSSHMEVCVEDIQSEYNKLREMDFSINIKHVRQQLSVVTSSAA